ncbi:LLM class flavin-dependent oxidoreductase [Actinacidiphila paucisporea]|uniref:Luciferase family oxidoreductase, group 1 n=1 Tax=Actinacidiphila paucisporea TaxID=310782 RepID=A0A1M7FNV5_9ACTN|nr:LLM class flavin-dependent oxidoreductase [Actinacidiphila paucisporea]SHM05792.1 luciferase family oxidoreductase, group 1 [Actinacidiphila paucisporea]
MNARPAPRLSVLDVSPVFVGSSPARALRETVELARHVDALGYHRFWVAEHHGIDNIASCSPPVLIGQIAAATSRLRVGSGGVMLANHSPLIVAEQFGTLEALHPGRIDLGLGRAPGADRITAHALRRTADADDFTGRLGELLSYFGPSQAGPDAADDEEAGAQPPVRALPALGADPEVWLLGSSGYSAELAGLLGLPFAFAQHFSPALAGPAVQLYRERFRPSAVLERPYVAVSSMVVAADTDEEARWLAGPMMLTSLLQRTRGISDLHATPEQAARFAYSRDEADFIEDRLASHLVGGPQTVHDKAQEVLAATGADELMALTMVHDLDTRVRSYRILADVLMPEKAAGAGDTDTGAVSGSAARR